MEALRQTFREQFGQRTPTHVVTAPGRINLIGEHIDYNGLAVFPMALDRRVTMLFGVRDDAVVRVHNLDRRFAPLAFAMSSPIEPYPRGEWGNYVKAAVHELTLHHPNLHGFDAAIRSDIPVAAGLSSSSALVVASALALIHANELSVDRAELMDLLARAERYVGTRGGGMDQAISVGAVEGAAARIDFNPLLLTPTEVPGDWRFVVANSLVEVEKSGSARNAYNERTRECGEALALVAEGLGLTGRASSYPALLAAVSLERALAAAQTGLPDALGRRFRHVVTEAGRVTRAERAMRVADLDVFGRLMSESHRSLRDDFEVSAPELDELTEIATTAGAVGARLTGAGFGGCIIALCSSVTVDDVLSDLWERFYSIRGLSGPSDEVLFTARPGGGAAVRELSSPLLEPNLRQCSE